MKALHFGAGNIGRGFIGLLLHQSGYDVVFADVVTNVVETINTNGSYRVIVVGDTEQETLVTGIKAVMLDSPDCFRQVVDADVITMSVGVRNLPAVAQIVARGLTERARQGVSQPVNIFACENAINATDIVKSHVYEHLEPTVLDYVEAHVGFANVAVDRIVPNLRRTDARPLDVVVEEFFEWDIEKTGLVGLPNIAGATFVDQLAPYLERKLFLLNGTHATVAYLGYLKKVRTIYDAMQDTWIQEIATGVQQEAIQGLLYAFPQLTQASLESYAKKIIKRFFNSYLEDDVIRVGRDPMRKLGPNERLVSPLKQFMASGSKPQFIPMAMAAGYLFSASGDDKAELLQGIISERGIAGAIREVSGDLGDEVIRKIVQDYQSLV